MEYGKNVNNIKEIILYEDKDIIVCRKPAGFPVQSVSDFMSCH